MDIMQILQDLWTQYGEVIVGVVSGLGFGSVGVFLGRAAGRFVANKITGNLDRNKIVSGVSENVIQGVSEHLAGHAIDVDISAVVDARIQQEMGRVVEAAEKTRDDMAATKKTVALVASAVSRSRLLTQEEQAKLADAADELEGRITKETLPVTKIKLEVKPQAVKTAEPASEAKTEAAAGTTKKKLKL